MVWIAFKATLSDQIYGKTILNFNNQSSFTVIIYCSFDFQSFCLLLFAIFSINLSKKCLQTVIFNFQKKVGVLLQVEFRFRFLSDYFSNRDNGTESKKLDPRSCCFCIYDNDTNKNICI